MPTLRHHPSSQVVEIREKLFMVDCGEGTQVQLRRAKIKFTKLQAVFITHLHGDHCLGLIGMLSTFGMLGRTAPLHIYAPQALEALLQTQIAVFCPGLEYEVKFHAVETTQHQVIYEDRSLTVESIPLAHRLPCCGFLFREKPVLPHIRREMIDFYEIPVSQINNIKNGADWTTPEGEIVSNHRLTYPAAPPRSYAYCSDTRYLPHLHQLVQGWIRCTMRLLMTRKTKAELKCLHTVRQPKPPWWRAMLRLENYYWGITVPDMTTSRCYFKRQRISFKTHS